MSVSVATPTSKQKKTNPKASNLSKSKVARLSKAKKQRIASRNSRGMETWLGQGVIMPTLNQLPTLKLPDWDEDPDLPELEAIDEIEARGSQDGHV